MFCGFPYIPAPPPARGSTLKTIASKIPTIAKITIIDNQPGIFAIAVPLYLFTLTNSLFNVGLFFMLIRIPSMILTPHIGVFVEKINKKNSMVICDILSGILFLIISVLIISDVKSIYRNLKELIEARTDPTIQALYILSGGAITFVFMLLGAGAVISLLIRSAIPGNIVEPPLSTMFENKSFLISISHLMIEL